jgi:hypothetical protein
MGFRGSKRRTPYSPNGSRDCSKVAIEAGLKSEGVC